MSAQLMIEEGAEEVSLQINDARCARGEYVGDVFICEIDASGFRERFPAWVYALGVVGCIEVSTPTLQESMRGEIALAVSWILFRNQEEYRVAHSIARRLAKATRGNPARILAEEWSYIAWGHISVRHPFFSAAEGGGW